MDQHENNTKNQHLPNPQFLERLKLYEDTIACKKTDRVLTAPMIMYLPINLYGQTTIQAVMEDWDNGKESYIRYHQEFQPDLAWGPQAIFPSNVLDILDCQYVQWPGRHFNNPNRGFQILDKEYMHQEEYQEYIQDPSGFMLNKVLPRHYAKLHGLSMIDITNPVYLGGLFSFIPFSLPPVKAAMEALSKAGEAMLEIAKKDGMFCGMMVGMGFPMALDYCAVAPFDIFNDTLRGLINTTMDMLDCPEELLSALEVSTRIQVQQIKKQMSDRPIKTVVFFIHNGMDDFMSLEQYETF